MKEFASSLWRGIPGRLQWWVLWATNPTFNIGVAGVFFAADERVLLLKHVFRREYRWGLPSGWMRRRETVEAAAERELLEEAGLRCKTTGILTVRSGFLLRVEIIVFGELLSDLTEVRIGHEIFAAQLFKVGELPAEILPQHVEYIGAAMQVCRSREGGQ